jgi:hypothetical protein
MSHEDLLKNAYDLHIHAGPDVVPRRAMDHELARGVIDCGMKGFVIKSHYFNTAGRAALIRALFPECNAIGAMVLNNTVGGLNPEVVEMAARLGTKIIWFPTMDAQNMWDYIARSGFPVPFGSYIKDSAKAKGIRVLDEGRLAEPVYDILDIIAKNDMILATGHISKHESLALLKEAKRRGVSRLIVTHTEFPPTFATINEQKEFIGCGAKIEHDSLTIRNQEFDILNLVEHIRGVGAENIILTSDLGQVENPFPMTGFADYINTLLEHGITKMEIEIMIVHNPAQLVE